MSMIRSLFAGRKAKDAPLETGPGGVDGLTAMQSALRNKARKFPDRKDPRFQDGVLLPACTPSFTMQPGQSIFTIGSCFARNVEDVLLQQGFQVPTGRFEVPRHEAPGRPNRILNQYNPGTMLQCLQPGTIAATAGLYGAGDGLCLDGLLATGVPVSVARAAERRAEIERLYREGLAGADYVFITLGLIECWYDEAEQLFLNIAPTPKLLQEHKGRFKFRRLSVSDCEQMLDAMLGMLSDQGKKGIVTVSPVPLQVTFAGGDAVTRNSYSKAVLRAACETVLERHPGFDYFPSYEIALSSGLAAFEPDNVHVRPAVVDQIIAHLSGLYLPG